MTETALDLGLIRLEVEETVEAPQTIVPAEDTPTEETQHGPSAS